jgi:hypothetical protein
MSDFKFHSKINSSYTEALTKLIFFNENQHAHYDQIVKVIDKFGEPRLVKEGVFISLNIVGRPDSKSVFVSYGPAVISALIYLIEPHDTLQVVHIVTDPTFNKSKKFQNNFLTITIIEHLKEIAKRLQANKIKILYTKKPLIIDL